MFRRLRDHVRQRTGGLFLGLFFLAVAALIFPNWPKPDGLNAVLVGPTERSIQSERVHVWIDDARTVLEKDPKRNGSQQPAPIVLLDVSSYSGDRDARGDLRVRVSTQRGDLVSVKAVMLGIETLDPKVSAAGATPSLEPLENCRVLPGDSAIVDTGEFTSKSINKKSAPPITGLVTRVVVTGNQSSIEVSCPLRIQTSGLGNGHTRVYMPGLNAQSLNSTPPVPTLYRLGKSTEAYLGSTWASPSEIGPHAFTWGPSFPGEDGSEGGQRWDGLSVNVADPNRDARLSMQMFLAGALVGIAGGFLVNKP